MAELYTLDWKFFCYPMVRLQLHERQRFTREWLHRGSGVHSLLTWSGGSATIVFRRVEQLTRNCAIEATVVGPVVSQEELSLPGIRLRSVAEVTRDRVSQLGVSVGICTLFPMTSGSEESHDSLSKNASSSPSCWDQALFSFGISCSG